MKVLFCQFGIPEVDALQPQANTALAAGYLIAYLKQYYPKFEFIQTPFWIADKMGMETFYQFIENDLPDIICFSLYLWNIDKTKTIINYLKKKFPLLKFIIGGPEVNDDNFAVLEKINFDAGVIGEGEEILRLLLATENWESVPNILLKNGNNKIIHTSFEDLPFPQLNRSRNPYLNDCLQHEKDHTIFVETVRGCPYRCKFCNYNKRYQQLQYNELAVLKELIQWAISNGKKEIFLLDPSFNVQTRFDEILELIIAENLNKQLCFATELRADLLTKEQIEKMSLANIVEVEVGLQSTNPIALKAMNRTQNLTKIVENVKLMQIMGIACKVDLIVGLPQDTLGDFKKSVDFLYEHNLFDDIQVFPLSVLSGTDFRKDKEKLGLEIMEKSPYYLKSSPTFSHEDFLAAFAYAEKKFGIDLYTLPELWLATTSLHQFENYAHKIILDFNNINLPITNLSESFYLHLKISATLDNYDLDKFFQQFEMLKSHYLFTFVFDWQREPTESEIIQILALLPHHKDHYVNRDLYPYLGDDVMVSTRWAMLIPYQYSQNHELREFAQNNPVYFKINGEDINDSILKELYLFVENMDEKYWGFIEENYEYDQLQFQNWEDQKKWNLYHEINVEIDDLIIGEFNSLRLPL